MKAKSIKSVPVKKDGSAFAINFLDEKGHEVALEFPASEFHKLSKYIQAISSSVPSETSPPEGTEKAFLLTRYEIGKGFPEGICLTLQSQVFGRISYAFDNDTARDIAHDLQSCADSPIDQSSRH